METARQKAARLLTALEELIQREESYLRFGEYEEARQTRQGSAPLVTELVRLAYVPEAGDFRPRVAALVGRSVRHAAFLRQKLKETEAEVRRISQACYQVSRIAPAYAPSTGEVLPRFQAAG